jgi:hypothetical protein
LGGGMKGPKYPKPARLAAGNCVFSTFMQDFPKLWVEVERNGREGPWLF